MTDHPSLVLASKSAARRALLAQAGVQATPADAGVDETAIKLRLLAAGQDARDIALALAQAKALAAKAAPGALVIGADQTLELDGGLIDKADDMVQARARLMAMRGRSHHLHSAIALVQDGTVVWSGMDSAHMVMRDFTDAFLDAYLATEGEALLSSVGCYRLEGLGAQLFDRVEGDYFTVLGLPLWPLLNALRARGAIAP